MKSWPPPLDEHIQRAADQALQAVGTPPGSPERMGAVGALITLAVRLATEGDGARKRRKRVAEP